MNHLFSIEKQTLIRAPRARVWRALADAREFGTWFGMDVEGEFTPGARVWMTVRFEQAKGTRFSVEIVAMEAEQRLAWRWSPGIPREGEDRSQERPTTVTFTLEDAEGGTRVTVEESGFDGISAERRARVMRENTGGWEYQLGALTRYAGTGE